MPEYCRAAPAAYKRLCRAPRRAPDHRKTPCHHVPRPPTAADRQRSHQDAEWRNWLNAAATVYPYQALLRCEDKPISFGAAWRGPVALSAPDAESDGFQDH